MPSEFLTFVTILEFQNSACEITGLRNMKYAHL